MWAHPVDVVDEDGDPIRHLFSIPAVLHTDRQHAPVGASRKKVGAQLELTVPTIGHVQLVAAHLPFTVAERTRRRTEGDGGNNDDTQAWHPPRAPRMTDHRAALHAQAPSVASSIVPPPSTRSPA
jgi:hypothetical protein